MASEAPAKPKAGLSLYANLLDPSSASSSAPGTISRAPVVFKQPSDENDKSEEATTQKQQISAATLRFQPTKRPQISSQKPKPTQSKALLNPAISSQPSQAAPSPDANESTQRSAPKTTIADWTGDGDEDDVNGFYGEKRQRGGRKKRKKNKEESHLPQNWDDIYDPSRPNNYEEYKNSDEKIREVREWKDKLYAHRMATRRDDYSDSDDERPRMQMNHQFAPPSMSFAPPPSLNNAPAAPPAVDVPDDATGEDAYARRLRLSQQQDPSPTSATESASFVPPVSAPSISPLPSPPPPPPYTTSNTTSVQATQASSTISRAPVRYNLPAPPPDIPRSEDELANVIQQEEQASEEEKVDEDTPRSSRPGQKGFAERLMSKYGWTKGTGLGAKGSGIINPLRVQVEKQKKKPNSEGGGFAGPGGRGKIVGGKKVATGEPEGGKFGPMSEVVILRNMMEGMDIEQELGEGNLMQEIGEECGAKYGRVERVFIDRSNLTNAPVFVKFTNQLSALRAVNALEGRIFNGNVIVARFFDSEKFEKGTYD